MSARRRLRALIWAIAAVVLVLALVFGLGSKGSSKLRHAPPLPGEHLSGASATLSSLLSSGDGRPTLVLFWASWCGPCQQEAPEIERFAASPAGRGRIVGVDWSDARSGAQEFIHRYRWTFPNLRDGEGTVGNEYRLPGLPSTFVLDSKGRIAKVLVGPQTQTSLQHALTLKLS
jgi:cytochrome c biogenesis protein CcmG/thiol:disulfide interchange protein DsbE